MITQAFRLAGVTAILLAAILPTFGQWLPADISRDSRIEAVSRDLAEHPADVDLLLQRAGLYRDARRWEEMIRDLDRVIQVDPRNVTALGMRGLGHGLLGRIDQAFADVDAALAIEPERAGIHGLRGSLLLNTGRPREAVEAMSRAIAIAPDARVYFDRAFCHRLLGEPRRALADYTQAHRLDPDLVDARCERGHVYQELGEFSRAVEDFEYCRRNNPDDLQAKLSLAWLLATSPDDGVRSGRRALVLAGEVCDPVSCEGVEPLNALAAAYAELGEYAAAESLQERAASISHFMPQLREACVRRLEMIRKREPIREARTPPILLPREPVKLPREVTLEEALAAPADVLARAYLATQRLLSLCAIAREGATIEAWLDGLPLTVTSDNAVAVEKRLEERKTVYREAIENRGYRKLEPGYASTCRGDCLEWGVDGKPVLVEQQGCDVFLTQGDTRHRGVLVETAIALVHDANTDVMLSGQVTDQGIVLQPPRPVGFSGTADEQCVCTLTPADVEGPDWAMAFVGRAAAHRSYGEYAAMVADLSRSLELSPNARVAGGKAYVLATCSDERVRDGRQAVEAAELALKLAKGEVDADLAISLAVAYAEAGDFAKAIEYQKKLIELVPDEAKPQQREHLRMFEAGKAFHEEAPF
jgi:tetratricopeptide (TPR) repeat protein